MIASNRVAFIANFGWVSEEEYLGTWYEYMNIWENHLYDDAEDKRRAGRANREEQLTVSNISKGRHSQVRRILFAGPEVRESVPVTSLLFEYIHLSIYLHSNTVVKNSMKQYALQDLCCQQKRPPSESPSASP